MKPSPSVRISNIKIRIVDDGLDGLVAWASCVVNGAINLNNIAIRRGRDGSLFLTYPAKRTAGGEKYNYFHPISADAAQVVEDALIKRLVALVGPSVTRKEYRPDAEL